MLLQQFFAPTFHGSRVVTERGCSGRVTAFSHCSPSSSDGLAAAASPAAVQVSRALSALPQRSRGAPVASPPPASPSCVASGLTAAHALQKPETSTNLEQPSVKKWVRAAPHACTYAFARAHVRAQARDFTREPSVPQTQLLHRTQHQCHHQFSDRSPLATSRELSRAHARWFVW